MRPSWAHVKIRSRIAALQGYVPGHQPTGEGWIKLNTNESPAVSPRVLVAIREAATPSIRLYPDPLSSHLRERIALRHNLDPDQVIVGNGSDDLLNLVIRAVAEPGDRIVAPVPSYALYPVLAAIQGCEMVEIPLGDGFALPVRQMSSARGAITFVASPNNPAGTHYSLDDMCWLAERCDCLVVDEAYVEFADADRMELVRRFDNVCITRSFSKAFGLAGMRVGYAVGPPSLIAAMYKVKDSYNVGRLAQVAALAALDDMEWAIAHWKTIRDRRDAFAASVRATFGLHVYPSDANFVFVECAPFDAEHVQRELESQRILVRRFADNARIANALRISVGDASEMDAVFGAMGEVLDRALSARAAARDA